MKTLLCSAALALATLLAAAEPAQAQFGYYGGYYPGDFGVRTFSYSTTGPGGDWGYGYSSPGYFPAGYPYGAYTYGSGYRSSLWGLGPSYSYEFGGYGSGVYGSNYYYPGYYYRPGHYVFFNN